MRIGVAVRDQRVRPLREEQRALGQRDALLLGVVAVVEADADDLLRQFDHRRRPYYALSHERVDVVVGVAELTQHLDRVRTEQRRRETVLEPLIVDLQRRGDRLDRRRSARSIPLARVCG